MPSSIDIWTHPLPLRYIAVTGPSMDVSVTEPAPPVSSLQDLEKHEGHRAGVLDVLASQRYPQRLHSYIFGSSIQRYEPHAGHLFGSPSREFHTWPQRLHSSLSVCSFHLTERQRGHLRGRLSLRGAHSYWHLLHLSLLPSYVPSIVLLCGTIAVGGINRRPLYIARQPRRNARYTPMYTRDHPGLRRTARMPRRTEYLPARGARASSISSSLQDAKMLLASMKRGSNILSLRIQRT